MIGRAEFDQRVLDFLAIQKDDPSITHLTGRANLFECGVLDSLGMVELIVFLEKLVASVIPVEELSITSFYSLDSMWALFAERSMDRRVDGRD